ncbi:hypothetical protein ACFE04_004178 [Oxalis oulophora]
MGEKLPRKVKVKSGIILEKEVEIIEHKTKVRLAEESIENLQVELVKLGKKYGILSQQNSEVEEQLKTATIKEKEMRKMVGKYKLKCKEAERIQNADVDQWMKQR